MLGTYSGNMSADLLTVGSMRNVKPELAESKGKRLLIAAESEEGVRLSTSVLKQLASTDQVYAEKKYKAPFHKPRRTRSCCTQTIYPGWGRWTPGSGAGSS